MEAIKAMEATGAVWGSSVFSGQLPQDYTWPRIVWYDQPTPSGSVVSCRSIAHGHLGRIPVISVEQAHDADRVDIVAPKF